MLALFALSAACSGTVFEPGGEDPFDFAPSSSTPLPRLTRATDPLSPSNVRLLTRDELGRTYASLVGTVPVGLAARPQDPTPHYFPVVSQSQTIGPAFLDAYEAAADEAADALLEGGGALTDYAPECATIDRACAVAFIDAFVPFAYRRALEDADRAPLLALFDLEEAPGEGLRQVIRAVLLSPHFLYLVQEGDTLSAYEVAARLSYSLCGGPPDAALREAAASGALSDSASRVEQARRLLGSECGRRTTRAFFGQWLGVEGARSAERSAEDFPEFTPELADAMVEEAERFVEHVVFDSEGALPLLLTAGYTVADDRLTPIYGDDLGLGPEPALVDLPDNRGGVLTLPAVLTANAKPDRTSPVRRGVFVLERLLCESVPAPPNDVPPLPVDEETGGDSPRDVWERHISDPSCASCHTYLDPVGFALEQFDEIGRFRTHDRAGFEVDSTGGFPLGGIEMGGLSDAAELAAEVAETNQLHACFSRQWFRHVYGRLEEPDDSELLLAVAEASAAGATIQQSMLEVFASEHFIQR